MAITNIFDLDLNQKPTEDHYCFYVNQTDYLSRTVQANLYITYIKNGDRFEYNLTDETVYVIYKHIDSNGEEQTTSEIECTKVGENVITFLIPNEVAASSGDVKAQIKIYEDTAALLSSVLFLFRVNSSI